MSVLDRVKAFLPQIEAANNELAAKIHREGAQSVCIDGDICNPTIPVDSDKTKKKPLIEEVTKDSSRNSNEDSNKGEEELVSDDEDTGRDEKKIINLEFALGDFDSTILAQMEDEKERDDEE